MQFTNIRVIFMFFSLLKSTLKSTLIKTPQQYPFSKQVGQLSMFIFCKSIERMNEWVSE